MRMFAGAVGQVRLRTVQVIVTWNVLLKPGMVG